MRDAALANLRFALAVRGIGGSERKAREADALDRARLGDLANRPARVLSGVADGHGMARFDVMYNDFVIVGPPSDPAGVAGMTDAVAALTKIAEAEAPFASRGDDSGTNKAELRLWKEAGIDAEAASGGWYRETGSGMGATLNIGTGMGAYVLADRATWSSFGNKGHHRIVVEGDPRLFNQYGIILVNPERHPNVEAELGRRFVDWILSEEGQSAIASYKIGGRQLFFPNARS